MKKVYISSTETSTNINVGLDVMQGLPEGKIKVDSFEYVNLLKNIKQESVLYLQTPQLTPTSYPTCTIPAGSYTADELSAEVQRQLKTYNSNWACGYNDNTGVFTISYNAEFKIRGEYNSTLKPYLGFSTGYTNSSLLSGVHVMYSNQATDLNVSSCIYVCSNVSSDSYYEGKRVNVLQKIQLDVPIRTRLYFKSYNPEDYSFIATKNENILIELRDENFELLPSNNLKWRMGLILR